MGKIASLNKKSYQTQLVGNMRKEIAEVLKLDIAEKEVVIYSGAIKHIRERHPYAFKKYFNKLIEIIEVPDYVGIDEKDNHKIEFIKSYKENVLVALRLEENHTIFISTMYILEEGAIKKRIDLEKVYKLELKKVSIKEKKRYKNNVKRLRG